MNITEANAANVVLRELIARHQLEEEEAASPDDLWPESAALVDAAALLADRANKALGAGLTGQQVRASLTSDPGPAPRGAGPDAVSQHG